jgi:hypothetical protein
LTVIEFARASLPIEDRAAGMRGTIAVLAKLPQGTLAALPGRAA